MLIKNRPSWDLPESAATPESVYLDRRKILKSMGFLGAGALLAGAPRTPRAAERAGAALEFDRSGYTVSADKTPYEAVTTYNNFYEFGTDKDDPARYAHQMTTDPWSIEVAGHCARPGTYSFEDLVPMDALEERVYRFRCVEAWSMVVPWVGVPLATIINSLEPTSKAKYVAFETYLNAKEMPGVRFPVLDWPYVEGLRMDEAMHPLTLMVVGLYGRALPNQNGAPLRLIVPWKYGFKSIKSIVRIAFVGKEPPTSWNKSAPHEYGFYSNVNPAVDHPRWSQKTERPIGGGLASLFKRQETLPFNGYAEEVASLYKGMNLKKYF